MPVAPESGEVLADLLSEQRGARVRVHVPQRGAKAALLVLWLSLPLAAALAPGEVAAGAWPREALLLRAYAPAALALTALLLLAQAGRSLRDRRLLDAARGAVVGLGTAAWLLLAFRDPSFDAYRRALPGLVLAETAAGFLLGAAARGPSR